MARIASIAKTTAPASDVERALLKIDGKAPVLRVVRVRYDDNGRPLSYEEVVLPLERFPGLASDPSPGIFELARRYGLSLGRATERATIATATADVASHLGIAARSNVVKLDRIIKTADGVPVEWRVAYFSA